MPWELIVLNSSFERTPVYDGGLLRRHQPLYHLLESRQVVFLCELVEDKSKLRNGVLDQTKKVCRDRPDLFFFPKTWEEAEALIPRLLKEKPGDKAPSLWKAKEEFLQMKTVAVVPMKLNNRRLPQKNTKPFTNGKPLCWYILSTPAAGAGRGGGSTSIAATRRSRSFCPKG